MPWVSPVLFDAIDRVTHELRPVEERSRDFIRTELDDDARRAPGEPLHDVRCGVLSDGRELWQGTSERLSAAQPDSRVERAGTAAVGTRPPSARHHLAHARVHESRVPGAQEAACNLGLVDGQPTTIHDNERAISDHEWANGGPRRFEPAGEGAPTAAVVGSGPAGLVAAWELARRALA